VPWDFRLVSASCRSPAVLSYRHSGPANVGETLQKLSLPEKNQCLEWAVGCISLFFLFTGYLFLPNITYLLYCSVKALWTQVSVDHLRDGGAMWCRPPWRARSASLSRGSGSPEVNRFG